jgi:putative NADH-flavin reductase
MSQSSIKNVLVIGASGNVGKSTIKALLDENFSVTGLTRESSKATLPANVKHIKTDYSAASLLEAFKEQDAVISTLSSIVPGDTLSLQTAMIEVAIEAGVKVFVPSEFGIDTSDHAASTYITFLKDKLDTVDYLKTQQDKISWTAIVSGAMFDWGLNIPGFGGFDVAARTATLFDGGDIPYEATTLDQVGRAIAKSLKHSELTKNQYVYVNSFTVTQNEVLGALEKATGETFNVSHGTVEGVWQDGAAQVKNGQMMGVLSMLAGAVYGKGGLANFSVTKGLWNEKLGLSEEDLNAFVETYVNEKK